MKFKVKAILKLFQSRIFVDIFKLLFYFLIICIATAPIVFLSRFITSNYNQFNIIISIIIGLGFLLFCFNLIVETIIVIQFLNNKSKKFALVFYSRQMLNFTLYNGLLDICNFFFFRLIKLTSIISLVYRLFGMKIGENTIINSTKISDCDIISIGKNTIIDEDVVINGHNLDNGFIIRNPIEIGNHVTIGQYTTISTGSIVEDNVIIKPNSFVPMNSVLKAGHTYEGVPVRKLSSKVKENLKEFPSINYKIKTNEIEIQQINKAEILLKSYGLRHNEVMNLERHRSAITVSTFGLIFTIITYSLLNKQPQLISLLPILLFLSYAISINLYISMIKLGFHMSKIELLFKKYDVKGFDWELKNGIMGSSRSLDFDNNFVMLLYLLIISISCYLTYTEKLVSNNELFIGYSLRKIVLILDLIGILWSILITLFYYKKRKEFCKKLNE